MRDNMLYRLKEMVVSSGGNFVTILLIHSENKSTLLRKQMFPLGARFSLLELISFQKGFYEQESNQEVRKRYLPCKQAFNLPGVSRPLKAIVITLKTDLTEVSLFVMAITASLGHRTDSRMAHKSRK